MAKKLQGDFFYLTANDLISGAVVYFNNKNWSENFEDAIKIHKDDLEKYDKIAKDFEKKCFIIGHFFVEINKNGSIRKLRDKIRRKGITFKQ
jgi:hypothetical protein